MTDTKTIQKQWDEYYEAVGIIKREKRRRKLLKLSGDKTKFLPLPKIPPLPKTQPDIPPPPAPKLPTEGEERKPHPRKPDEDIQANIDWSRFMCVYANPVGQVYVCVKEPSPKSPKATSHIRKGERIAVWSEITKRGLQQRVHGGRVAIPITEEQGKRIAIQAFNDTDGEYRFGFLDGPTKHILYRNEFFEVQFSQAMSFTRPFVIVHSKTANILRNGRGVYRLNNSLLKAIQIANEEEGKLKR